MKQLLKLKVSQLWPNNPVPELVETDQWINPPWAIPQPLPAPLPQAAARAAPQVPDYGSLRSRREATPTPTSSSTLTFPLKVWRGLLQDLCSVLGPGLQYSHPAVPALRNIHLTGHCLILTSPTKFHESVHFTTWFLALGPEQVLNK